MKPVKQGPVRLSADRTSNDHHMIAPVCATCGREIDKSPLGQWAHVGDRVERWAT